VRVNSVYKYNEQNHAKRNNTGQTKAKETRNLSGNVVGLHLLSIGYYLHLLSQVWPPLTCFGGVSGRMEGQLHRGAFVYKFDCTKCSFTITVRLLALLSKIVLPLRKWLCSDLHVTTGGSLYPLVLR
jgi:hypothetical protein